MTDRRPLHAYLGPAEHECWHATAAAMGCSVSSLLAVLASDGHLNRLEKYDPSIAQAARRLDTQRRRRGR